MENPNPPRRKSWSIHTRTEITSNYEILNRVGSGAYSDVYKARRLSDDAIVALKEVHDHLSASREIDALQSLAGSPNVVALFDYFYRHDDEDDEDAVLVLEFLPTDLASVIAAAKNSGAGGISVGEVKRWMLQILSGVEACHRSNVVHRDLKPGNLLIAEDGTLKIADFGQARILMDPGYEGAPAEDQQEVTELRELREDSASKAEEYLRVLDEVKARDNNSDAVSGDGSCRATCTASEATAAAPEDYYDDRPCMTSCVGTRWFRAPELLFGSTDYGLEIDLWSVGCVFAELLSLEPLFPGSADVDQLARIIDVLGNLTPEVWPGCVDLPDYNIISFARVENPKGLGARLLGRSLEEVSIVERLVCFDPAKRASAAEIVKDRYFGLEPLPVPISDLKFPLTIVGREDGDFGGGDYGYDDDNSDSDFFDEFGSGTVTATKGGFSIKF